MRKLNLLIIISLIILSAFSCQNETIINENQKSETVQNLDDESQNQETKKDRYSEPISESLEGNRREIGISGTDLKTSNVNEEVISNIEKPIIKNPFYQEKEAQIFKISKSGLTTIYGEEGTKITVNSNDFIYESNGKKADKSIQIELQEYYKLSDILKANLTTTTKDEILETAGMIHLAAFANGEKLALKTGKTVEISFPFETKKEGMKLFSGEREVDSRMVWTAMTKTAPSRKILPEIETDEIFDIVEEMPLWKACDNVDWTKQERRDCSQKELLKFIYTNIKYPTLARENDVSGTAVISFVIEKDGSITNETIVRNPGAGTGEEALRVIKMLPNLISGRQRGKSVRVRYNLPVRFRLESGSYRVIEIIDSTTLKQKFTNDSTINTASTRQIDTYLFGATSLGWINCDRFIGLKRDEKTSLFVESTTNDVLKNGDVKLIFRNLKTIMNSTKNGKNISFDKIPKNETVIVFALKFENGQYYMALQEAITKASQTINLDFELVTLAKLEETMQRFDTLF